MFTQNTAQARSVTANDNKMPYNDFHMALLGGCLSEIENYLAHHPGLATFAQIDCMPPVISAIHHSFSHQNSPDVLVKLKEYNADFNCLCFKSDFNCEFNPLAWLLLEGGDSRLIEKLITCGTKKDHPSIYKAIEIIADRSTDPYFSESFEYPLNRNPYDLSPVELVKEYKITATKIETSTKNEALKDFSKMSLSTKTTTDSSLRTPVIQFLSPTLFGSSSSSSSSEKNTQADRSAIEEVAQWQKNRLRFEQELLRKSGIVEAFTAALQAISKKGCQKPNGIFICYPKAVNESENEKLKNFLIQLRSDLHKAGLALAVLDVVDVRMGGDLCIFTKKAETSEFVLLIGTEDSCLSQDVVGHIARKQEIDARMGRSGQILPILISGNVKEAFPPAFRFTNNILDWQNNGDTKKSYFAHFCSLVATLYKTSEATFKDIWWNEFLCKLNPDEKILVEQGLTQKSVEDWMVKEEREKQDSIAARNRAAAALMQGRKISF